MRWHHKCLLNEYMILFLFVICYLLLPLLPESVTSMRGQALQSVKVTGMYPHVFLVQRLGTQSLRGP